MQENRRLKSQFTQTYPNGCCKIVGTVSLEHEITKAKVMHWLLKNGYDVWSEVNFNGARVDIIAIKGHIGYVIEILHTESEKRFESKKNYYPGDFTLIRVDTKTFDYSTFCL
jgi:hypothetical protein